MNNQCEFEILTPRNPIKLKAWYPTPPIKSFTYWERFLIWLGFREVKWIWRRDE